MQKNRDVRQNLLLGDCAVIDYEILTIVRLTTTWQSELSVVPGGLQIDLKYF